MVKKAFIILIIGFLTNNLISSCCTETWMINDINFSGVELISDHGEDLHRYYREIDTFKERIVFRIDYSVDYVSGLTLPGKKSYATSCGTEYINKLLDSSFSLTSNESITVEGELICPGENWWTNSRIKKYIHYFKNANDDWHIEFVDDFQKNATIKDGNYKFYFECETDDNKSFRDSVEVIIDLS